MDALVLSEETARGITSLLSVGALTFNKPAIPMSILILCRQPW